jgi:hypothetical protein
MLLVWAISISQKWLQGQNHVPSVIIDKKLEQKKTEDEKRHFRRCSGKRIHQKLLLLIFWSWTLKPTKKRYWTILRNVEF